MTLLVSRPDLKTDLYTELEYRHQEECGGRNPKAANRIQRKSEAVIKSIGVKTSSFSHLLVVTTLIWSEPIPSTLGANREYSLYRMPSITGHYSNTFATRCNAVYPVHPGKFLEVCGT